MRATDFPKTDAFRRPLKYSADEPRSLLFIMRSYLYVSNFSSKSHYVTSVHRVNSDKRYELLIAFLLLLGSAGSLSSRQCVLIRCTAELMFKKK